MPDFDQGGTFRTRNRIHLGPSIGWVDAPEAIVRVATAGTVVLSLGTSVVTVNVNGTVTIQLPIFKGSVPGVTLPGLYVPSTITIIDTGGFAGAHPITILPGTAETISGLASTQINSPNGAVVLQPDPVNGGSTEVS